MVLMSLQVCRSGEMVPQRNVGIGCTSRSWKYLEVYAQIYWGNELLLLTRKLDEKKKAEGNELDEFQAHKFLEYLGETLTVIQVRA